MHIFTIVYINFIFYLFISLLRVIIIIVIVIIIIIVRSNLEYASVAWNNLTLADSNKLENIQRKFTNLCYNRFIQPNCSHTYQY
jgi:hypothetical protein